jgi:hypothetical protein
MDNLQVQTPEQPVAVVPPLAAASAGPSIRRAGIRLLLYKCLQRLASLRLTVVLFALSIILVFAGTLAQVDAGIWTVVSKYFRSFYVWIPLQIFFPRALKVSGGFPFPGGWLLGTLLLVNLLAAHAIRFKASWKRSGIILLHGGLIVIMLGELITGLFAVEGSMPIWEGGSANYVINLHETELAVSTVSAGDTAEVVVVPMADLRRMDGPIKHADLAFDVEVIQYMVNSRLCTLNPSPEFLSLYYGDLLPAPPDFNNPATAGIGVKDFALVNLRETGGVEQNKEDVAGAYIRFRDKNTGKDLGTYLFTVFFNLTMLRDEPQFVKVDGIKYDVRMRLKRTYKPYTMDLIEFRHDRYVGTDKPKNFSSRIRLIDPARNENREVLISMNNPLRYGGETFYQSSVLGNDGGTVLQVVQNPGWLLPYISCVMVAVGMIIHFGLHLQSFLQRRAAQ